VTQIKLSKPLKSLKIKNMKKISLLITLFFSLLTILAQSPDKFSYQAVVRNAKGELINNKQVGVKISIIKDQSSGIVVYSEIHTPTTNANGLFSIEIGTGDRNSTQINYASLGQINWGDGIYFIKNRC
jgi:hypothetical protein